MGKVDVISDEIIEDYNPKSAIFISYCFYIQPINSMQTHTHTHQETCRKRFFFTVHFSVFTFFTSILQRNINETNFSMIAHKGYPTLRCRTLWFSKRTEKRGRTVFSTNRPASLCMRIFKFIQSIRSFDIFMKRFHKHYILKLSYLNICPQYRKYIHLPDKRKTGTPSYLK